MRVAQILIYGSFRLWVAKLQTRNADVRLELGSNALHVSSIVAQVVRVMNWNQGGPPTTPSPA